MDDQLFDEQPSAPPIGGTKRWIKWAKTLIAIVVIIGLGLAGRAAARQWRLQAAKFQSRIESLDRLIVAETRPTRQRALRSQKAELQAVEPRLRNLNWHKIACAALLYAVGLLPSAMVLRRAVITLGGRPRVSTAVIAQLFGHVGKYVPGKAMVVIIRGGVLAHDRVRPLVSTIAVFLETFLMMAVGAVVAAIATARSPVPAWITTVAMLTAVLAGLPTLPPVLRRILAVAVRLDGSLLPTRIGWNLFCAGWAWSLLSWLLIGVSFTLLISAIPSADPLPNFTQLFPIATAAISLAMVVGFASLLPGGAGVRELVLTTVLGVAIGPVHGLLAAIAARLTFMAVEALLATGCWACLRAQGKG